MKNRFFDEYFFIQFRNKFRNKYNIINKKYIYAYSEININIMENNVPISEAFVRILVDFFRFLKLLIQIF